MNKEKQCCECATPVLLLIGNPPVNDFKKYPVCKTCGLPIASNYVVSITTEERKEQRKIQDGAIIITSDPIQIEAVENGGIPSSGEKWVEEAASLCSHKTCTEVCDNIILIRSLLAAEREEVKNKVLTEVMVAFGKYWPISGADLDDLPKLAKEMSEGLKAVGREEVIKGAIEGLPGKFYTSYPYDAEEEKGWNSCLEAVRAGLEKLRV